MSIFLNEEHLNPKYDFLDDFCDLAYKSFWTPARYKKKISSVDVPEVINTLTDVERTTIERCILAVLLVEDKVKTYWSGVVGRDLPQTIIGEVGGLFGQMEVTHAKAYRHLGTCLGVDVSQAKKTKQLNSRVKYLQKYLEEDPKIIGEKRKLKRLVLFTSLVERCSLFTQFYILMSFAFHNKGLQNISALQQSTALEEILHYNFGLSLVNLIKEEKPHLWDEYLVDLINKNIKSAFKAETKLIEWFFQEGTPEHLDKEEVLNFLKFNFQEVSKDFGLDLDFKCDLTMYEEKSSWMLEKMYSSEPDFFNSPVGNYSSIDNNEDVDIFG